MSVLVALGLWATLETLTVTYQAETNPHWPSLLAQALDLKGGQVSENQWRFRVRAEHAPVYARLLGRLSYIKQVDPAAVPIQDLLPDPIFRPSPGPSGSPDAYWSQDLPRPQAVRVDFRAPVERRSSLFASLFETRKVRHVNRHTFDYLPPAGVTPVEAAAAWRLSPWIRLAEPVFVP